VDPRLEQIFEAWYDYEYSPNEEAKLNNRQRRATLIMAVMRDEKVTGAVGDFLHSYRDAYQNWAIRKHLKSPRKRF
jgi:hypothetical protein